MSGNFAKEQVAAGQGKPVKQAAASMPKPAKLAMASRRSLENSLQ
jgi:hypothetical protein